MYRMIKRHFEKRVKKLGIPGAAAAIISDDGTTIIATGEEEVGSGRPITTETLFSLASCSKAFTAVGLARLVDQGELRFDDRVARYLPEFALDTRELTENATLRDLLGMRLGLEPVGAIAWGRSRHVPHSVMLGRLVHLERKVPFRKGFIYSNISYTAIAEIIARVSGMRFADYMKDTFESLGLDNSFIEEGPMGIRPGIAVPHVQLNGSAVSIQGNRCGGREGESCQYSSIAEMATWLRFHLEGGVAMGTQALSRDIIAELHSVQMPVMGPGGNENSGYCMGWMRGEHYGAPLLAHEGGELGASTFAVMAPDQRLGVVVLLNLRAGAAVRALAYELFDLASGRPIGDWLSECQKVDEAEVESMAKALEAHYAVTDKGLPDLDSYSGLYRSPHSGELLISRADDRLEIRFADMDTFNGVLRPLGGDIFETEHFDEIGMQDTRKVPSRIRVAASRKGQRYVEGLGLGRFVSVD